MHLAFTAERSVTDVVKMAHDKLRPAFDNPSQISKFACLSIRVLLDLDSGRSMSAHRAETELVRAYMRVVFAAPRHGISMQTGTPSEPVLVEAAAELLEEDGGVRRGGEGIADVAPKVLLTALDSGWISKCKRGELLARLLLIMAHDAVLRTTEEAKLRLTEGRPIRGSNSLPYHRPLRVVDFLKQLLHTSHHTVVLGAKPVGPSEGDQQTLEDAYKDAYVTFSHFGRAGDDCGALKPQFLSQIAMRGLALQFCANREYSDIVIPVVFTNGKSLAHAVITPESCSIIQVRVTNVLADNQDFPSPVVAAPEDYNRPVLTLLMEFGSPTTGVIPMSDVAHNARSGESLHRLTIRLL